MNKSPLNFLVTVALGALLWVIFTIILGSYLSENPTLSKKDPAQLATELQIIFGIGTLLAILFACYWFWYGAKESTVGELNAARKKWYGLFFFQIILSVALVVVIVIMNRTEGIEPKWFGIYFGILSLLTFVLFWLSTFLMSPRSVKFIPLGK